MFKTGVVSTVDTSKHTAKVILDGADEVITADLKFIYHEYENEAIKYPVYAPNDRVAVALTNGYSGVIIGRID